MVGKAHLGFVLARHKSAIQVQWYSREGLGTAVLEGLVSTSFKRCIFPMSQYLPGKLVTKGPDELIRGALKYKWIEGRSLAPTIKNVCL
jgi:hypothetical protein